jgi:RNA polymerase sigma-70 factor, ECF subfamily
VSCIPATRSLAMIPERGADGAAPAPVHEAFEAATQDASSLADARDVALALRGDEDAYDRLVRRHQSGIARLMWRFTRDPGDQDELVQEVFVTAWQALRSWRGTGSFGSWLRSIAVRTGYAFWRNRKRDESRLEFTAEIGEVLDQVADQAPAEAAVTAAATVHGLLSQMSDRDRLVLTLLHLEELSVAEIAAVTGWSASMVKVQAWRARGKLRKLMEAGS